jgi:hypothetical protein
MRESQRVCLAAAAALLFTAAVVRAQCVTTIGTVSQPGTLPNYVAGPIATNGSVVGMGKSDTGSGTPAVYAAIYDTNLNQIAPDRQIASTSFNGAAAMLWNGTEFALFFQSPSFTLMWQRIDPSGNPIGTPISIVNHPWSPDDEFDVAWSPERNGFAIARTVTQGVDRGLWLTVVSPVGSVLADTQVTPFVVPPTQPRVFTLPDGTIGLVWIQKGDTPFLALSLVPPAGVIRSAAVSERNVTAARVATNGSTIVVIFSSLTSSGGTELRYAQFNTVPTATKTDSSFLSGGVDIVPQQLLWNPVLSEWALTYIDARFGLTQFGGDTRLRRFTFVGTTPSDTLLSPDPIHSRLTAPYPFLFTSGGYVATIQRVISRTEGSESYLVRLCPLFVTATADHPVWRPFVPVTFTATSTGGVGGYSYEWQFGDNDVATGAVVQHIYQVPGTYTVTLTGRDAAGATALARITVQITTTPLRSRAVRR